MDVTLNNFKDTLPKILEAIDSCDFIAIDGEFTGLRNGPDITAYDTPSVYYTKVRDSSLNFLLIQVGLCTFKFDSVKKKYVYKAFNFYVFPRRVGRCNNDVNFLCQASCISFLCSNGFDFNKLFNEGIPYLNIADEESLQEEIQAKYENLSQCDTLFCKVTVPEELMPTVEEVCSRIENFLSPDNTQNEIIFDKCNSFLRKCVFQTAYERFGTKNFSLVTRWVDNCALLVAQKGKSKAELDRENFEKEKDDIKDAVGFSKILKHISNSKKLIVGHNMLLDICHIVNRFCWPLPESYWEFKEMVHQLFPRIIDTKFICSAYPFRDLIPSSVMDHMMKKLQEPPFNFREAEPEDSDYGYSMQVKRAHEAGFDAYMTGLAFISLTSYLGKKPKKSLSRIDLASLKSYENRLYIMKIMDYKCMNLVGKEPKPSRKHVFHITFPKEWKTIDITQLFRPFGDVHIAYCNETTAWITLLDQEKSEAVVNILIEANLKEAPGFRKPYTVITWRQYQAETNPSKVFKNIPASPVAGVNLSPTISQSTKDVEPVDVEIKSPNKRISNADSVSRKKKKSEQEIRAESLDSGESMEHHALKTVGKFTSNLLFEQLNDCEDDIQKTFEEPAWE